MESIYLTDKIITSEQLCLTNIHFKTISRQWWLNLCVKTLTAAMLTVLKQPLTFRLPILYIWLLQFAVSALAVGCATTQLMMIIAGCGMEKSVYIYTLVGVVWCNDGGENETIALMGTGYCWERMMHQQTAGMDNKLPFRCVCVCTRDGTTQLSRVKPPQSHPF